MSAIAKVTPIKVGINICFGSFTKKDMNIMRHSKAKPTMPTTELGIRNSEACHDCMIGPQEMKGFKLHEGTWFGSFNSSIFSQVSRVAARKEIKLRMRMVILLLVIILEISDMFFIVPLSDIFRIKDREGNTCATVTHHYDAHVMLRIF
jgi:hypothetical protein